LLTRQGCKAQQVRFLSLPLGGGPVRTGAGWKPVRAARLSRFDSCHLRNYWSVETPAHKPSVSSGVDLLGWDLDDRLVALRVKLNGRAPAFQAGCSGFDSRHSLHAGEVLTAAYQIPNLGDGVRLPVPAPSGGGEAWHRARFGTERSRVQIPLARLDGPKRSGLSTHYRGTTHGAPRPSSTLFIDLPTWRNGRRAGFRSQWGLVPVGVRVSPSALADRRM
jgi:hypothetical protein